MLVKWLECRIQYSPEAPEDKQYSCKFIDYNGKFISLKVGGNLVYVDYIGPPKAPYICHGYLSVGFHEQKKDLAVIALPFLGSNDNFLACVKSNLIEFNPPDCKLRTICLLRRQK